MRLFVSMLIALTVFAPAAAQDLVDPVKIRQAKMKAVTASVKAITDQQRRRAPDWSKIEPAAAHLDALGKTMHGWFTVRGTGGRTSPAAFSDRAAFDAEVLKFRRAARSLPLAAAEKDKGMLSASMDALRETCVSCHKKFRQKK